MKTSKFTKLFIAFCAMSALVACGGPGEVDARDQFIGGYDYQATGKAVITVGPAKYNVPLDASGVFTISKVGNQDQVIIVGYNDTINATVSGDQLILESNVTHTQSSGVNVQLTFDYDKATLVDNKLSWTSTVKAYATSSGFAAYGDGEVSVVATKK